MAKKTPQAYSELKEFSVSIHTYSSISNLLHWDQETYMPSGAITPRSRQIALLSGHIHDLKAGRKFRSLLEKLISIKSGKLKTPHLSQKEKIALREWRKDYLRAAKLPSSFVKTFAQTTSEASQIWQTAKKENNFKLFAPFLDKIVQLNREKASIYGFEEHPYEALVGTYEPSLSFTKIKTLFASLKTELGRLLEKIENKKPIDDRFLNGSFDPDAQMKLGHAFLAKLPLDPAYNRLDLSSHPFSTALHPHDSRITTRILKNGFASNLFSILHEAGHSLYEMGLPSEQWGTPLAEAVSLSIHESQSRWWETLIGRSFAFWKHMYPMAQRAFPAKLQKISLDRFYRGINRVSPSLIRVEADEVTYCLHVILRFEIEAALISGDLPVADLPQAWNEKMRELLGIVPKTDREGCLQDIHWSLGEFGYFPTYALGNLFAAQFFQTFAKDHPDWEEQVSQGELHFIRDWLKLHVHSLGKQYDAAELAKHVTGKPFSESAYCHYLKTKYSEIYHL